MSLSWRTSGEPYSSRAIAFIEFSQGLEIHPFCSPGGWF